MKLVLYPAFVDERDLTDHYYRLHWYLNPLRELIASIVVPHKLERPEIGALPDYLDPNLTRLTGTLPISYHRVDSDEELEVEAKTADALLLWSSGSAPPPVPKGKVIKIDHSRERNAGSFYLYFAQRFAGVQREAVERSEGVFSRIRERCTSDIGYIFGTGPGLRLASGQDCSDGVSIACNSMVRNRELLEQLEPSLFVVADPIFHAGCSSYAAAFRQELIEALDRYHADLVVPLRDYHIYTHHLPQRFADRIAGIPYRQGDAPNLDLSQEFAATTTGNVLTLFLIPLASTFFRTIRISGCDGRPAAENFHFWSYDKASQINEEMGNLCTAHPGFFEVDYDDYYSTHCDTLDRWLAAAERVGRRVENLTPSHIPALMKRTVPNVNRDQEPTVSIVMLALNAAEDVESAMRSVADQELEDWELLIVDDGSEDETPALVYRWALDDERIVLMRSRGTGTGAARKAGVAAARGKVVTFLDPGDVMEPGALRRLAQEEATRRPPSRRIDGLEAKSQVKQSAVKEPDVRIGGRRETGSGKPLVALIEPDALDWGGHFIAYSDKLSAALESQGYAVKVICNKDLDPEILQQRPDFSPSLSVHTWVIGNRFPGDPELERCESELRAALDQLATDRPVVAYMYTGSVDHAAILARLTAASPRLSAHVNLFYAAFHERRWEEWSDRNRVKLQEIGAAAPRLRVTVPTSQLQRAIAEASGEVFEVAPSPSTAIADHEFALGSSDGDLRGQSLAAFTHEPEQLVALFPGNPRTGKGFESTLAAVERLAADETLRPVLRYYPHPKLGDDYGPRVEGLPGNVHVVRGELGNEEFLQLFRTSHLSVLPYEPIEFGKRTSGLLVDSLYHGLPVVTTRRTWLGDHVERYGCGVVVDENSPDELASAVREVAADHSRLARRARIAGRAYFAENSWNALAQSIVQPRSRRAASEQKSFATKIRELQLQQQEAKASLEHKVRELQSELKEARVALESKITEGEGVR
jgi:glycosyltransferase involved in cell wall biosynthesis